jgi:hypothetical protein
MKLNLFGSTYYLYETKLNSIYRKYNFHTMNILYPGRMIGDGIDVRPSNLISDEGDDPGNGLFATMAFRQGDMITTYDGEVISSTVAKTLDANSRPVRQQTHMKSIDRYSVIDGIKQIVPGRGGGSFINDPQRRELYNAKMDCVKPRGQNKDILPIGM